MPKNILIAHNDYARFSGEENAVRTMGDVLTEFGHTVSWLRASSAIIDNRLSMKIRALASGFHNPAAGLRMERRLSEKAFDIVQVQNLYPFLSPAILYPPRRLRLPVVMRTPNYRLFCPTGLHLSRGKVCERCLGGREWNCVLRNCMDDPFKSIGYAMRNAFARVRRSIIDNVTLFIVLSRFQRQRFIEGGIAPERIAILPNIAPDAPGGPSTGPGDGIAFVGRVSPEKGITTFLDAAARLPDKKFIVAGETSSMPGIEKRATENVTFTGFLKGPALDALFEQSRILVFPSMWFEGFPNVIAKAMSHGKPVIAGRIGAIPEIVAENSTGLLFEPGNAAELTDRITRLYARPERCRELGENGRRKAAAEYSREAYYRTLMESYARAAELAAMTLPRGQAKR